MEATQRILRTTDEAIESSTTHAAALPPVVELNVAHGIAEIVLNRPAASNAIDITMATAVIAAVEEAVAGDARVLLIRGNGRMFCAGGDLAAIDGVPDPSAYTAELVDLAHQAVRAIDRLEIPVVAAVHGAAAGVGLSLVLCADVVVAAESARFVTAYTSVGLTPDGGMSWLLPRVVGQRRAVELLLTSEPVSATRALDLGIVSRVCAEAELREVALAVSAQLAGRPTHALGASRRLVRESWARGLDEHLDAEAAAIIQASGHEETGALIDGFLGR